MDTRPWVVRLWMGKRESTVSVRRMRSGVRGDAGESGGTAALGGVTIMGCLLAVDVV
jgi:hypothetical protein